MKLIERNKAGALIVSARMCWVDKGQTTGARYAVPLLPYFAPTKIVAPIHPILFPKPPPFLPNNARLGLDRNVPKGTSLSTILNLLSNPDTCSCFPS